MKKLIIAAAVCAFAAVSQAATASWSFTEEFAGTESDLVNLNGYTAYLVAATDWNSSAVLDSVAKNIGSGSLMGGISDYYFYGAGEDSSIAAKYNDVSSAYMVLVSGDESKYAAYAVTGLVGHDLVNPVSFNLDASMVPGFSYVTTSDLQAIPEPTSGLLLLLGVAGLALRRRRA